MNPQSPSSSNFSGIFFGEAEAKHRMLLVQWLNSLLPSLNLPINITDDELKACLSNGVVLCQILNKLRPGSVNVVSDFDHSQPPQSENVKRFLTALDGLGVQKFEISDLQKGHMKSIVDCLLTLRAKSLQNAWGDNISMTNSKLVRSIGSSPSNVHYSSSSMGDQRKIPLESKFQSVLRSPVMAVKEYVRSFSRQRKLEEKRRARYETENTVHEPSAALLHHVGHKFQEVFPLKQGSYADLPASKISELMKSTSLDNAPTQSLLSVVNAILEESVERRNGEIPHRVACLLRKVVQEIERRISTQSDHLKTQNNLFKAREEKYQSRIKVLEALASGTREENKVALTSPIKQFKIEEATREEKKASIKIEEIKKEEKKADDSVQSEKETKKEEKKADDSIRSEKAKEEEKRVDNQDAIRLTKELDNKNMEISTLKQDLETMRKTCEEKCSQLDEEAKGAKDAIRLTKELDNKNMEISTLKQDLETMRKTCEEKCSQLEEEAEGAKDAIRLTKELGNKNMEISTLKQGLETMRKTYEEKCSQLEEEAEGAKDAIRLTKELGNKNMEISTLKEGLETMRKTYEEKCSQLEEEAKGAKGELKQKSQEYEHKLEKLRNKVKETEASTESKYQKWNMKVNQLQKALTFQFGSIQKLKLSWESIKKGVLNEQIIYAEECNRLGVNLKPLVAAAENYQAVLTENRKMFNELQELKGNIRVYCRIRPFLPGQKEKQSIVENLGETDLVVANPAKQGKEALRTFKFNKVFGPASTQEEVYSDIQDFIRSVLDGYNVCIFAYGQTGSGKTYTMSGPNGATGESLGVNYRALNDLFSISLNRQSSIVYEIGVQMVEIYNEQVRDLLSVEASPKKLGILSHSQPNGLAVPDASMYPVKSTSDVIKLMDIGMKNRAKGSTAMNERSSRSHSVVSIHVRGLDKKSGSSSLQGNLHLVDLAGSERVDRSEVTGDRLKEAQHINKSLSALGDVIYALAQKTSHVPYRNSKLTQLLQSSLGGQAKTLMLVQINSDIKSFSESLSTLKFAERASGVELGAAKSTKDGRDVRELMEQVASLRDTILTKDEEIERLQLLKDLKNVYPAANSPRNVNSPRSVKSP